MITCQEFLQTGLPRDNSIWLHCLDVVEHCLKGDIEQTLWRHPDPSWRLFEEWRQDMLNRSEWDGEFQHISDNAYIPVKKWTREEDFTGEFNVDMHLANLENLQAPRFDQYNKRLKEKPAVTVVYSANVNYGQRQATFMVERHQKVYEIASQCESERRPCRVVAVENTQLTEIKNDTMKIWYVIKDYMDPIFPAIWGSFVDNRATNSFLNVTADFLTGTHSWGNGQAVPLNKARRFFPEDEELIIFGNDIKE